MSLSHKTMYYEPKEKNISSFCDGISQFSQKTYFPVSASAACFEKICILCIGTDKVIGDCLGPLVGTKLSKKCPNVPIYGTLRSPIHGGNLSSFLSSFQDSHRDSFVIAIDASVGDPDLVGMVTISSHPLSPGKGILKKLPKVGNISITGIVHPRGPLCDMQLSCIRLSLIDTMAEFISHSLAQYLKTGCMI